MRRRGWALTAILMAAWMGAAAQRPLWPNAESSSKKTKKATQAVQYLYPEQVTLTAGKASSVELHFRVAPGLHINSHDPKDKFLIPTAFTVPAGVGVTLDGAQYPAGVDYTLPADPKTRLNVYSGEFTIQTRMRATAGDHLVQGELRYQACDEAKCMPPKTMTVAIDVVGK